MKKFIIAFAACALVSGSFASKGFQASLVPDVAIHDRDTEIKGLSIGVWNENPGSEWQIGFVNGTTGDSKGFQSFIPFLFFPAIYNYADDYTGVQLGIVNYAAGDFVGAQLSAVNIASNLKGLQFGAVNYCTDLTGLQLGFVNWADHSTSGLQIGVANIIPQNKWFADGDFAQGMIIVNWGF